MSQSWFKRLEAVVTVVWRVSGLLSMIGVGAISAWYASLTAWLQVYGPYSYVLAGTLGALFTGVALGGLGYFLERLARLQHVKKLAQLPSRVNPFLTTFDGERIELAAFRNPFELIVARKVFQNCELLGPAVVVFDGANFVDQCQFIKCDFIALPDGFAAQNLIVFQGMTIRQSKLYALTVLMPESEAHVFEAQGAHVQRGRMVGQASSQQPPPPSP